MSIHFLENESALEICRRLSEPALRAVRRRPLPLISYPDSPRSIVGVVKLEASISSIGTPVTIRAKHSGLDSTCHFHVKTALDWWSTRQLNPASFARVELSPSIVSQQEVER